MSGDFITCSVCGEEYHRKSEHDCPGSLRDLADQLESLENELHELTRDHVALLRALLTLAEARQFPELRNMVEPLLASRV